MDTRLKIFYMEEIINNQGHKKREMQTTFGPIWPKFLNLYHVTHKCPTKREK